MTFALVLAMATVQTPGSLVPTSLTCEYLRDPLGIDVRKPRLCWKLEPKSKSLRDLSQTAYRVLVASDPKKLDDYGADAWDSGRVFSSSPVHIEYGGKPLESNRVYWWVVQVWDQNGQASAWSKPAKWSMGLLQPSDWKASWIGFDAPLARKVDEPSFRGAKWIWHSGDKPNEAPREERFFAKDFDVPEGIAKATLMVTVDDQFSLRLNGAEVAKSDGNKDAWRRPVTIDALPHLKPGRNEIRIRAENADVGTSGLLFKLSFQKSDGSWSHVISDKSWTASKQELTGMEPAREFFNFGDGPWGWVGQSSLFLPPPRFLRREFGAAKPIRRAMLYGSALGLADFHLNGQKVGDELFLPGWTDYEKRVYYRAYDVTKSLKRGRNALGAVLGDGWYAGYVGYGGRREHYGDKTRALAQLVIEYTDGSQEVIATDRQWKATTGPILESDFLMGEQYDARLDLDGWDQPGFDDGSWSRPDVADSVQASVEAFPGNPVRVYAELKAKSISRPQKEQDVYVLDLGQNMAGFARLTVRGKKGQKITLRFAERLNPDGTIYTTNLRSARTIDTYVCKGEGVETWQPRFTFHGFQYIEVSGLGRKPGPEDVVGLAISSDTERVGFIETSDPMINQLVSNAWWTQRMNFIDIPTDCPQRDERLGWTGDAQAYIRTAIMNDDVGAFFTKWLVALDDAQREDGQYPMVAPLKVAGGDGGPGWADAGVICPWAVYDAYGDRRLLQRHYPQMKKFIEFMVKRSRPELLPPKEFHCFGDWVSIGANTPNDVIYSAYFAFSTRLMAQAASALGLKEDAEQFEALFLRLRDVFNKAYVSADGTVKGDTQCAYVLALANDLLVGEVKAKAEAKLVADIEKRGWRLTTGFLGTRDVMHVLSKIGRNDVAFRLLHSTEFPSWGFTIKNGATSIWERWDGWTPAKGFQDPGMNSFAHYAFGAVVGWIYDQIGGIDNTSPGFETVRIAPQIDPRLTWAKTSYDSIRGKIECDWRVEGGKLNLRVAVPPGVKAEVVVPTQGAVKATPRVRGNHDGSGVFHVGSGEYRFESDWKR